MNNFIFENATKVYFGRGCVKEYLANELTGYGQTVMLAFSYMKDFKPFTTEEYRIVAQAAEIIKKAGGIPCTNCRYCIETCPMNIAIPDYLALYQKGNFSTQFAYYFNIVQTHGRAGDCIACGQCENHCPQHIEIINHLKEVSQAFDGFKGYR